MAQRSDQNHFTSNLNDDSISSPHIYKIILLFSFNYYYPNEHLPYIPFEHSILDINQTRFVIPISKSQFQFYFFILARQMAMQNNTDSRNVRKKKQLQ